jgi:hypothetical protein
MSIANHNQKEKSKMIQLNRMQRANKEAHNQRMTNLRYITLMAVLIVAFVWLMVHVCFIETV